MKKTDVFIALLVTLFALVVSVLLTSCGIQPAPTATVIPTMTIPTLTPVPAGMIIPGNNDKLWAGSPIFADGTTSRACFNTPIASYFIYDPNIGTWMAMVCQLTEGYGIVFASPNVPFAIEAVTEYDVYLRAKGYSK